MSHKLKLQLPDVFQVLYFAMNSKIALGWFSTYLQCFTFQICQMLKNKYEECCFFCEITYFVLFTLNLQFILFEINAGHSLRNIFKIKATVVFKTFKIFIMLYVLFPCFFSNLEAYIFNFKRYVNQVRHNDVVHTCNSQVLEREILRGILDQCGNLVNGNFGNL